MLNKGTLICLAEKGCLSFVSCNRFRASDNTGILQGNRERADIGEMMNTFFSNDWLVAKVMPGNVFSANVCNLFITLSKPGRSKKFVLKIN